MRTPTRGSTSLCYRGQVPTEADSQLDYMLVDGSGSMMGKWWDVLDALQAYVDGLQGAKVRSRAIVAVFDGTRGAFNYMVQRDSQIETFERLEANPIGSDFGGTPLYDAINKMCRDLRDLDPKRCRITIATDGGETCSEYTDLTQAKSLLDWCRAKGWQITFIGCDFANDSQAKALGANESNAIGVARALLKDATQELAKKATRHAHYGEEINFSEEERQQFGGYLSGPSE